MAEDEETPLYAREAPDQPVKAGDWAWATTTTEDGAITHGHNADWIYQDGWKNPGGVLKVGVVES